MTSVKPQPEAYEALYEFLPDTVLVTDRSGAIGYVNRHGAMMFGYTAGELLGKAVEVLVPGHLREQHQRHRESYYETMPVRPMGVGGDLIGLRKDGTKFPVEISLSPLETSKGVRVISVIRDVTTRRRLEEAIKESEERYRSLVELSPEAIVVHVLGRMMYVNEATARLLMAKSAAELIGRSLFEFIPSEYKEIAAQRMAILLQGGERAEPLLVKSRRVDGQEFYLETIASRVMYRGKPAAQVILRDISLRVRAEEELRASQEQLRNLSSYLQSAREDERTTIAREIHDELGGALTALKLDLASLEDLVPGKHQDAGLRQALLEKTEIMAALIDSTIQTVRRIATELRPVLLDSLGLTAAIEWQAGEFQKRAGIACSVSIAGEEIGLDKDRSTAVFRIFQETLTNVARHSEATHLSVDLLLDEATLELTVHDNGRGITEIQTHHSKSFGLVGMRERALLYGGLLTIKGIPGEGTTVMLSLPLPRREEG
jgi:two-component system, NarL family, sensor histidine kinase UhpB